MRAGFGAPNELLGQPASQKPGPHVSYGHKRITTPEVAVEFHVCGCEFTPHRIDYYFAGRLVQSLDATVIPHGPQNTGTESQFRFGEVP